MACFNLRTPGHYGMVHCARMHDRPFCFRRFVNLSAISLFTALPLPLSTLKYRYPAPYRQNIHTIDLLISAAFAFGG